MLQQDRGICDLALDFRPFFLANTPECEGLDSDFILFFG